MPNFQREELLILTKTYPIPSTKYRETTCVAALTRAGAMRRIFPVAFRYLGGEERFAKWEWIRAPIAKAGDDHRPESYKIDFDSAIERGNDKVPSSDGWAQRRSWLEPHCVEGFTAMEERRQSSGETLGVLRVARLLELEIAPVETIEWTEKKKPI